MKTLTLTGLAAVIVIAAALSEPVISAQQANSAHFEVASIKPSDPKLGFNSFSKGGGPGGRFEMQNTSLRQWVETGLSVRGYALRTPAWLDTTRFDLEAKLPIDSSGYKNTDEMIKALLVERFGLKWHEESQIVSGYELVAENKVLLKPATFAERFRNGHSGNGPSAIQGTNISIGDLATSLAVALGKPVVDATHLADRYDVLLRWRPSDDAELVRQRQYGKQYGFDVDNLPGSVFDAVREQLGLKLQGAKVPSKIIVVDHIDRKPTDN